MFSKLSDWKGVLGFILLSAPKVIPQLAPFAEVLNTIATLLLGAHAVTDAAANISGK